MRIFVLYSTNNDDTVTRRPAEASTGHVRAGRQLHSWPGALKEAEWLSITALALSS
jgi:hypothetical protein